MEHNPILATQNWFPQGHKICSINKKINWFSLHSYAFSVEIHKISKPIGIQVVIYIWFAIIWIRYTKRQKRDGVENCVNRIFWIFGLSSCNRPLIRVTTSNLLCTFNPICDVFMKRLCFPYKTAFLMKTSKFIRIIVISTAKSFSTRNLLMIFIMLHRNTHQTNNIKFNVLSKTISKFYRFS